MKRILSIVLILCCYISSYSTHLMGGQIIANYLSSDSNGSHYALELTTYRDTAGIAMQLSAEFEIYSPLFLLRN